MILQKKLVNMNSVTHTQMIIIDNECTAPSPQPHRSHRCPPPRTSTTHSFPVLSNITEQYNITDNIRYTYTYYFIILVRVDAAVECTFKFD